MIDGYYDVREDSLDLEVMESSIKKIREALIDEFVFLWHAYAEEKDSELTEGAMKIKERLLDLIEIK